MGTQTITLRHGRAARRSHAKDRALFARGALSAAKWLITKPAGMYGMRDFMAEV